ncbi:MAG: hypothetical protein ACHQNE_00260, partial [Candidatus Kapaibacterium sp.]
MKYLRNTFSPLFIAIVTVMSGRVFKRLAITGSVAFLAMLVIAAPYAHGQKLKNVSGTIKLDTSTLAIDSVIHFLTHGGTIEEFDVFFTDFGASQEQLFQFPPFSLGASMPWNGGSFATNDKHDGNGGVLCSFINSTGTESGSFSYSRFMPHLVRAISRDSAETSFYSLHAINNPPDFLNSFGIPYHLWMDGKRDDNDSAVFWNGQGFGWKMVLTDAKGKQIDSSQIGYSAYDTIVYLPYVQTWGRYTKKVSFVGDTLIFVPDTAMSLRYILNQAVYQSQCKGLPWLSFDASYTNVSDAIETPTNEGKGWQDGGGTGIIQDSGTIFINNILRFHGIMKIDTVNSLVDANGEFYVFTKLPLTGKAGPWRLGGGYGNLNWPKFTYSC